MLVSQKILFDHHYCIKSFYRLKIKKKLVKRFNFGITYYNTQKPEGFVGFKTVCSREKTNIILTSLNYVHFYARY